MQSRAIGLAPKHALREGRAQALTRYGLLAICVCMLERVYPFVLCVGSASAPACPVAAGSPAFWAVLRPGLSSGTAGQLWSCKISPELAACACCMRFAA